MRTWLRAVLFCACLLDLLSLQPSFAQDQIERKKEIPLAIAQEMRELQNILASQPNDPTALFNLAMDYETIGDGAKAWTCWKGWPKRILGWIPKRPPADPSQTSLATLDSCR
jgi:hypothetical protein